MLSDCVCVCVCANAPTRSHTHLREGLWRFWEAFWRENGSTWVGFEPLTCRTAVQGSNPYATGQLGMWLQGEPAHQSCAEGTLLLMSREAQLWASIARKRCEMGRRRCFHRLPRQKLCIGVSSDQKSTSGTPKGVFASHRDSNPRPADLESFDLPSGPACRCQRGGSAHLRVLSPGLGDPRAHPRPPPLCSGVSRAGVPGRAPLCGGVVRAPSGAGRRGAVVVPARDLYVASRACFSCPGSSWSLPMLLASCGELIAPRMSSWEALRAENDSVSCPLGGDRRRPSSTSFSTGLSSFWLIFGSPATSYRRDGLRVA